MKRKMADKEYKIKTYNKIADIGINRFKANYMISDSEESPDALMLRSFNLHDEPIANSVVAVGRAGAGVNNIPIDALSKKGVAVFNAPGANANSVKELVVAGMMLAGRNIPGALEYAKNLSGQNMKEEVEAGKKKFVGHELQRKTLGVIGLGSIGYRVANAGLDFGMKVVGYDPVMTIKNARQLSSAVGMVDNIDDLFSECDFVTIHVPLLEATKQMINKEKIALLKPGAVFLNFSRDELVDEDAMIAALDEGKISYYVTDFPNSTVNGHGKVISLPHLGASTGEAEDNCAVMIADQLQDYLENGNIQNSVNLPNTVLYRKSGLRLTLVHTNEPGMVANISNILSSANMNIHDFLNRGQDELAYTLLDLDVDSISQDIKDKLSAIPGIYKLRVLGPA